jgi:hypothetical protein
MKPLQADSAVTSPYHEYGRLKLNLKETEAEIERLQVKANGLHEEIDALETMAHTAAVESQNLERHMPATLYRILAEEGDEKEGTLVKLRTTEERIVGGGALDSILVTMTFSKSGQYLFKMVECGRAQTRIDGVNRILGGSSSVSGLWKDALLANNQDVPCALAAMVMVGFEYKRDFMSHDLLDGIRWLIDE